jgi:hypothetical protein
MNIFISYADEDRTYLLDLISRLIALQRSKSFTFWSNIHLLAGGEWKNITNEKLSNANIILVLVSANALASDRVYDEITQAVSQHDTGKSIVIPIIVRSCNWEWSVLEKVKDFCIDTNPINTYSDKDTAWTNIVRGVSKYIPN